MKRRYYQAACGLPLLLGSAAGVAAQTEKPNIILVMVDDLGYSDLGSYGSEIETPHLDRLASEGIRFQQFYNNSISAPTRASLLTGQYASKAGVGYFDVNLGLPAYQGYLNRESLTLGEVMKQGGYQTYLSGKWHVGKNQDNGEFPTQRGFDHAFGIVGGASTYFYNHAYAKGLDAGPLFEDGNPVSFKEDKDFYMTDAITGYATKYIREASQKEEPFFLYLAYTAPHWPLQARPEDIAKYKGRYQVGWDSLRTERINRQRELGIIPAGFVPSLKDPEIPAWESLTYDEKHLWARKMEVYAAMVDRVDQGIGQLLETLKETGDYDNTLIIFISDNGAPAENVSSYGGRAVNAGPVGTAGSYEAQGKHWSYVSNTPFREYKTYAYEGGISSPFIAWYPAKIDAGTITRGGGHIIDLAPTFYDIAGITYPATYEGIQTNPLPGVSLKQALYTAGNVSGRDLFWERAGNRAVVSGKYKLVSIYPSNQWELYDLEADRGETTDLAATHPEVVQQLASLYANWAAQNDVVDFEQIKPEKPLINKVNGQGITIY